MTPATDDDALEAAFEALLAGRRVPPAAEGLVAFADGVRATAVRAPRPSAALADLLATGLLTDQSSAPAPRAVRTRRRSPRMIASTLFAKLASAGIAAKAATVAGVAVVGVSTAGFTNALPAPAQHVFATVVDSATPLTAPDPTAPTAPVTSTDGTEVADPSAPSTSTATATETPGAGDGTTVATAPSTVPAQQTPSGNGLGSQVAGKVVGGYVGDQRVSDLAHQRNDARRADASSASSTASSTAPAGDGSTPATAPTEDRSGKVSGGKSGHGNG